MQNCTFSTFLEDSMRFRTIPIMRRFFADVLEPLHLFENLKDEASFLLESKDEQSPWSRYSFIGLRPFLTIESEEGRSFSVVDESGAETAQAASLKDALLYVEQKLHVKPVNTDLPFTGGAVGYIGYDVISAMEKVPPPALRDLRMKTVHLTVCESLMAFDHAAREITVVHYVRLSEEESMQAKRHKYETALQTIEALMKKAAAGISRPVLPWLAEEQKRRPSFAHVASTYGRAAFLRDVETIKRYIAAGDIFQAVLSQRFVCPIGVTGFELYRMLRKINPSPYMFYLQTNEAEIVGSSPEKLVQVRRGQIEIDPIAGTRRRGRTEREDEALAQQLLGDPKERAEHYMLVDLARNDVGKVAKYGTVQTPVLLEIGKFSHVMHLISKVTGELMDGVHPIDALLSAFPAGTVSGAPKVRAMQIINELEPTARNVYAGAIAYIGFDGNIDSCIAIRTAVVKDGYAYVQAGAGIVADSIPEHEWNETRNKASALIRAIELAEATQRFRPPFALECVPVVRAAGRTLPAR